LYEEKNQRLVYLFYINITCVEEREVWRRAKESGVCLMEGHCTMVYVEGSSLP
jgi:hypothetical protein